MNNMAYFHASADLYTACQDQQDVEAVNGIAFGLGIRRAPSMTTASNSNTRAHPALGSSTPLSDSEGVPMSPLLLPPPLLPVPVAKRPTTRPAPLTPPADKRLPNRGFYVLRKREERVAPAALWDMEKVSAPLMEDREVQRERALVAAGPSRCGDGRPQVRFGMREGEVIVIEWTEAKAEESMTEDRSVTEMGSLAESDAEMGDGEGDWDGEMGEDEPEGQGEMDGGYEGSDEESVSGGEDYDNALYHLMADPWECGSDEEMEDDGWIS